MKRFALLLLLPACGLHDIVVVDLPSDGGFTTMGPPGMNCDAANPCGHPSEFCEYASCAATSGKCRKRSALCPPDFNPVCGCNGVTYWNDCLRKSAGQGAATSGECGSPATCGNGTLCPDQEASCAKLLLGNASCSTTPESTCWVVPKTCPPPSQLDDAWETCGGTPVCGGLCSAIRSGQVRRKVDLCP